MNNKGLLEKISKMTKRKCMENCRLLKELGADDNLCCSLFYCRLAKKRMEEAAFELRPINPFPADIWDFTAPLPYLDKQKSCIVPPHFRPLCSLHICDSFLLDEEFAEEYFRLRGELR